MRTHLLFIVFLFSAFVTTAVVRCWPRSSATDDSASSQSVRRYDTGLAVTNVTVIDGSGRLPQPSMTVVIQEERIVAVRPAGEIVLGPEVRVISGRARYLIPGLWDMHAHLTEPGVLPLFIRHGVTGVRHMYSTYPLFPGKLAFVPNDPTHPRTVGSTHMLDGQDNPFGLPANLKVIKVTDPAGAEMAVAEAVRAGNDQIKVYPMLTEPAYRAVVRAARTRGVDVVGHLPKGVTAAEASDAGHRSIEHLDGVAAGCSAHPDRWMTMRNQGMGDFTGWRVQLDAHEDFDENQAAKLFEAFVRNGTYHVPTLVQTRASSRVHEANRDEAQLPPLIWLAWQRKRRPDGGVEFPLLKIRMNAAELNDRDRLFRKDREMVRRMHRAGVKLLAGTDSPYPDVLPGDSLHAELELLVEAGLTPLEAIRAATSSAAECLRRADRVGGISEGLLADFVLLDRDPTDDIRNTRAVRTVFVSGRVAWSAK